MTGGVGDRLGRLLMAAGRWVRRRGGSRGGRREAIGLALGGGFARAIAHVGVLRVFEERGIPVGAIAGVSAGAMVAAAWASGASSGDIEEMARSMRFRDVARPTLSRMGLISSERMSALLQRLLRATKFEEMKLPLAVVATDLRTGEPAIFSGAGDVIAPIRASCSYPGLFLPVAIDGRQLVDGGISMDVPALAVRKLGATRVVSCALRAPQTIDDPRNMLHVVNRCFQILQSHVETPWRRASDIVLEPEIGAFGWDSFESTAALVEAGRRSAEAAVPRIEGWMRGVESRKREIA